MNNTFALFRGRSLRTWVLAGVVVVLVGGPVTPTSHAGSPAPAETVDRLHLSLLEVMQHAEDLRFSGRRERLAPVITESFHFPFITQIVMGRFWGELSESDRSKMIETFRRLTLATYASRFDGYSGESFQVSEIKDMNRGRMLVRTELVRPKDEPVQLDYVLQEEGGRWLIVNVVANGVSDLSLKRADYGSIMKTEGFERLIGKLEAQIVELGGDQ